jgi:VWFA-related protein
VALVSLLAIPGPNFAAPVTSEQEPAPDEGAFLDIVNVEVVNVDVFVTDRSGQPITGLSQEDFQIFEDGRPVAITNFYAEAQPVAGEGAAPAPLPGRADPREVETVPEDQRLYLVVYVDNFNIKPFNRNRVFRRLREFLDANVGPEDRVMLTTYNRSLKQRVPFTSDSRVVGRVLFEVEEETGYGVHRDSERRQLLDDIEGAENIGEVLGQVRTYAGSYYNDTMVTIDALREVVTSLGGLPGRKVVLYVSDGVPMVVGEDIFHLLNEKFRESSVLMQAREFDAGRRFQELAHQANANRVSFYTIDAGGLRTMTAASAEQSRAGSSVFVDSQNTYNLQAPLITLAEQTGGRAIINTNDVGPQLARVATDLRTYYSLGYQPVHAGDGRYHRIEVKLREKQRGWQVRHRAGYRDKSVEQRMTDGTVASLVFGELGNPLGVDLAFGSMTRRDDGHVLVPIRVSIPLDKVTMIPQGDQQQARLRVFIAAQDERGDMSPVQNVPLPIQIPAGDLEKARQQGFGYEVSLLMRSGQHRVAVGVRDDLGAVSSYVTGVVLVR